MPSSPHEPVLLTEVLELLQPQPGARIADLTIGAGGHARELLERAGEGGRLLGVDRDPAALAWTRARFGEDPRVRLVHAPFSRFKDAAAAALGEAEPRFDAILLDLGVSSMQLDEVERGFSFRGEAPLDLRMDPSSGERTAAELVAQASERELADLLFRFGEERAARRIARRIVAERARVKLLTTSQLAELVARCVPRSEADAGRIHPATRTFQALRIAVNDEVGELEVGLAAALDCVAKGGRLAVLSYHSIEDRIVKHTFKGAFAEGSWAILTKKPVRPGRDEVLRNPRARSAKLRAIWRSTPVHPRRGARGGRGR